MADVGHAVPAEMAVDPIISPARTACPTSLSAQKSRSTHRSTAPARLAFGGGHATVEGEAFHHFSSKFCHRHARFDPYPRAG
jgi:hypothetical protein